MKHPTRILACAVAFGAIAPPWACAAGEDATFEALRQRMQSRAVEPYVAADRTLPDALAKLDYDGYRKVVYLPEALMWEEEAANPYRLRLYHRGGVFPEKTPIHIIDGDVVSQVPYEASRYAWGAGVTPPPVEQTPAEFGYAGLLVLTSLNVDRPVDELVSFLGASYFRALSPGQHYGLSARGLAVDTNLPSGEVFPRFDAFHVVKPKPGDVSIRVYATLDSPVMAGVYRFDITPGSHWRRGPASAAGQSQSASANEAVDIESSQAPPVHARPDPDAKPQAAPHVHAGLDPVATATVMDVKVALFPRADQTITKLGLAPMSSMFLFGEATPAPTGDYRTEVHDSDGLLLHHSTGEWLWRPLQRARTTTVSAFQLDNPRGFGLMQRDRDFRSYQDLEALYHRRPSLWVEPQGDWGKGHVELIEFPSNDEGFDNIVAMWVPQDIPLFVEDSSEAGVEYAYRLSWLDGQTPLERSGRALATRYTVAPEGLRFLVDFSGGMLDTMQVSPQVIPIVTADRGRVSEAVVVFNPYDKTWRLQFDVLNHDNQPVEIRAYLKSGDHALTETWTYQWKP